MLHARSSARRYGGHEDDYIEIHDWFDQTKAHVADVRHRAILHSSFGIFLAEQVFGHELIIEGATPNKDRTPSVRDIGEQHVLEDLGFIPSIGQWLQKLPIEPWMAGRKCVPRPTESRPRTEPTLEELKTIVLSILQEDGAIDRKAENAALAIRARLYAARPLEETEEVDEARMT